VRDAANNIVGDIYFPTDGNQPTTPAAAQWSCANVEANNLASLITVWYVNAFFGRYFGFAAGPAPQAPGQIMVSLGGTPAERMSFMRAFRTIAANPVGRVLLYRLLIEIRRQNAANNGCCEQGILMSVASLSMRNLNRMIHILLGRNAFGFLFGGAGGVASPPEINFCGKQVAIPTCHITLLPPPMINTSPFFRDPDIALFHEMLHWFHSLRNYDRFSRERLSCTPARYQYLSRCYYGDISELFTWCHFRHEEMRTILGAPNYDVPAEVKLLHKEALLSVNPGGIGIPVGGGFLPSNARFREGDDLSENAYRMARHDPANRPVFMRFGHGGPINPVACSPARILPPKRFQLASLVARNCCNAIINPPIINWRLVQGEAAQ
jgi:hypothetical protein